MLMMNNKYTPSDMEMIAQALVLGTAKLPCKALGTTGRDCTNGNCKCFKACTDIYRVVDFLYDRIRDNKDIDLTTIISEEANKIDINPVNGVMLRINE